MKISFNKVMLIGRVIRDPEIRYMTNGTVVTALTLATQESWQYPNGEEERVKIQWHRVVFFNSLALLAVETLREGAMLYVTGNLRSRKCKFKGEKDRYTTEIIASDVQILQQPNKALLG